jgi:hypothetical protein
VHGSWGRARGRVLEKTLGFYWLLLAFLGFLRQRTLAFIGFQQARTLAFVGFSSRRPWLSLAFGSSHARLDADPRLRPPVQRHPRYRWSDTQIQTAAQQRFATQCGSCAVFLPRSGRRVRPVPLRRGSEVRAGDAYPLPRRCTQTSAFVRIRGHPRDKRGHPRGPERGIAGAKRGIAREIFCKLSAFFSIRRTRRRVEAPRRAESLRFAPRRNCPQNVSIR